MLRRLSAALVAAFVLFCATPVLSQSLNPPLAGTLTAAGTTVTLYPQTVTSTCSFVLSGTWVGTVTFQGSSDGGTTWATLTGVNSGGSATANGTYVGGCAGYYIIRAIMAVYTSGTVNVTIAATPAGSGGASGGGNITSAPLTGGAAGVGTAPNQSIAIHGFNGATLDAIQESGGSLNVRFPSTPTVNQVPNLGSAPRLLTSASATACTSIFTGAAALYFLENANAASQTVVLTIFDEGASPTCATADIRGTYTLGQGQVIQFGAIGKQLANGLAYSLSAALLTGGPVLLQASK